MAYEKNAVVGAYRILRHVKSGSYGSVYVAEERKAAGREVALKILHPDLRGGDAVRRRFEEEARTLAHLNHPHILHVYEFGSAIVEKKKVYFYSTPYIVHGDSGSRKFAPEQAVEIIEQIADALDYAHFYGSSPGDSIYHRDVKPANILVDISGKKLRAYLADFGIAKYHDERGGNTATGAFVGSYEYASPEQLLQIVRIDNRSDQFSLACTLYEIITGEVLYPSGQDGTRAKKLREDTKPSVHRLVPSVPEQFDRVLMKALSLEREDRYDTCTAFAQAARGALASGSTRGFTWGSTRKFPVFWRNWKKPKLTRGRVATATVATVATVAVSGIVVYQKGIFGESDPGPAVSTAEAPTTIEPKPDTLPDWKSPSAAPRYSVSVGFTGVPQGNGMYDGIRDIAVDGNGDIYALVGNSVKKMTGNTDGTSVETTIATKLDIPVNGISTDESGNVYALTKDGSIYRLGAGESESIVILSGAATKRSGLVSKNGYLSFLESPQDPQSDAPGRLCTIPNQGASSESGPASSGLCGDVPIDPTALAKTADGMVYILGTTGGPDMAGSTWKIAQRGPGGTEYAVRIVSGLRPYALAVESDGSVYVNQQMTASIWRFAPGSNDPEFYSTPAQRGMFAYPEVMEVGSNGILYGIANNQVWRLPKMPLEDYCSDREWRERMRGWGDSLCGG